MSTPFDATSATDFSGNTTYPDLNLTPPAGVTANVQQATATSIRLLLATDVDAAAMAADFDLMSGIAGDPTDDEFLVPGGLNVTARMATALGSGPATGTIKTAYDSVLYTTTPTVGDILDITASASATGATPSFALLPKSGHFSDLIAFYRPAAPGAPSTTTLLPQAADPYYVVYWDNTGTTGPYTVDAASTAPAATHATVATDNTTAGAVVANALPFLLTGGSLADSKSIDWVKVTAAAGDVGKAIHVQTVGDPATDVAVTCYQSDGTTQVNAFDSGGQADGTCDIKSAGDYFITFAAGGVWSPMDTTYTAIIRIQ
jgi:hypothetical protein